MEHAPDRRRLRREICDWIDGDGYTHALTLNSDRELSLSRQKDILGRFLHGLDREVLDVRNVRRLPAYMRIRAIAFPENLETNAHLHLAIDLTLALARVGSEGRLGELIRKTWKRSTRGSGTTHLEVLATGGWSIYMTKHFLAPDHPYILSTEFHPA